MPEEGTDNTPEPATDAPVTPATPRKPSRETKPLPGKKKGKKDRPEPTTFLGKLWHNWVRPIGSVVVVVVLLRSTLLDWNDVPTGSMEPEIQVGDRILVNRLAYGLQPPLSGPKLSIPFTGLSWDNPLDGLPQWAWGSPHRGDIVTFWNPVTGIRMVKRIVAEPGDTISMSGGVLTINGTTATYIDVTSSPPRTTTYPVTTPGGQTKQTEILVDQSETLLGEERTVQLIKSRWFEDIKVIEYVTGEREYVHDSVVSRPNPVTGDPMKIPIQEYLDKATGSPRIIASVRDGVPYLGDEAVSFNEFAAEMFRPFAEGEAQARLAEDGLVINGHLIESDGKPLTAELLRIRLEQLHAASSGDAKTLYARLGSTAGTLQHLMMTSFGPVTLGPDEFFMVGDNRNNSHDSRYFGPVMRSEITGEAFAVAFSFKDNKIIPPNPAWERWFKGLD